MKTGEEEKGGERNTSSLPLELRNTYINNHISFTIPTSRFLANQSKPSIRIPKP